MSRSRVPRRSQAPYNGREFGITYLFRHAFPHSLDGRSACRHTFRGWRVILGALAAAVIAFAAVSTFLVWQSAPHATSPYERTNRSTVTPSGLTATSTVLSALTRQKPAIWLAARMSANGIYRDCSSESSHRDGRRALKPRRLRLQARPRGYLQLWAPMRIFIGWLARCGSDYDYRGACRAVCVRRDELPASQT